jgi:hypothetical protein
VRLRDVAREMTGQDRVAAVLASEIAVLSYGLASWRSRPHAPADAASFTHHRRSGHAAVVLAFGLVLLIEGVGVHLLLARWSALAAWIATAGTAYGALWLLADYRATVLRPILVDGRSLLLRVGLRFTLEVPIDGIASVERLRPDPGKDAVALPLLAPPTHWVMLSEPRVAEGPYGLRRRVRAIGVAPDDPEAFERRLRSGP